MSPRAPRILHVVSSVDRGGIEIWLLHLLRHIDRQRYPIDVLVLSDRRGPLERELRDMGCEVRYCANHRRPRVLRRCMLDMIRQHGPYDTVHSHVHYLSGAVVRVAASLGIPIRIVHSRNDMRSVEAPAGAVRRVYTRWMKAWIRKFATHKLAISVTAAEDLYGPDWRAERCIVVHSGRDFSPLLRDLGATGARQALGIPADALVVGHVGRLQWRKNQRWVVEVAGVLLRREPRARLLLVGDGADEDQIRAQVAALGIADRVVFAGAREDVLVLMKSAMDVFLFPSHHEGLGVAAVEAQAAGLPCVIAEHLPAEIDVVPGLVRRLPLTESADAWTAAVLAAAGDTRPNPDVALHTVLNTDFNIERSVKTMSEVYEAARVASMTERGP
jgi:glycosyltransferase involved in cell wall biosynthesis